MTGEADECDPQFTNVVTLAENDGSQLTTPAMTDLSTVTYHILYSFDVFHFCVTKIILYNGEIERYHS